jgi:DNA-binding NarL/FixJ family response regulator
LTAPGNALGRAAELLRGGFAVDRVSVARLHDDRFEIVAEAGAELLAPGTALPVSTCSYFAEAAQGRPFSDADFDASDAFARPFDGVVLAAGFHSGCSVPIRQDGRAIGALSCSTAVRGLDMARTVREAEGLAQALGEAVLETADAAAAPVLVCHADPLAGPGLARLVEREKGAQASVAPTVEEAIVAASEDPPDLVICDDWIGGVRVDEVARRLRAAGVVAPLVVVSSHDSPDTQRASLLAGASAHVRRRDADRALPAALEAVRSGRTVPPEPAEADGPPLTGRELELLWVLDEGLRFKQVAVRLGISMATAKTHARNLFRKLDATSRTEALRAARDRGLLV